MAFVRRTQRFCENEECNELLRKRDNEAMAAFLKRITCCPECAEVVRSSKKSNGCRCFCGRPRPSSDPYCSWEHRLIAIKCKRWGIPENLKQYKEHSDRLAREQALIDKGGTY